MYVILIANSLITSDAKGLRLHDVSAGGGKAALLKEVEIPSELPFFEKSPAGERLTCGGSLVARSFTPAGTGQHWTKVPSRVTLLSHSLETVASLTLPHRMDHESLALSSDGKMLATVTRGAGAIVFDALTCKELWRMDGEIASGVSWSPDSRYVALGESGQAGGVLTLLDSRPDGGSEPKKHELAPPKSKVQLMDSPFRTIFSKDGKFVVFTSACWGVAGVSVYNVESREEIWSVTCETTDVEEETENWLAPEVDLALGDSLVLVGQDGRMQAYRSADGEALPVLEYPQADARYFAADSERRGVWVTRSGEPTLIPFHEEWV